MLDISIEDVNRGQYIAPDVIERCEDKATTEHKVDASLLMAILDVERGRKGTVTYNTSNGSYDLGPGQVNTIQFEEWWFKKEYPTVTWRELSTNTCLNLEVAGRVLKQRIKELKSGESIWNAVGHYNSKTKKYKIAYLQKVMKAYRLRAEKYGTGYRLAWSK